MTNTLTVTDHNGRRIIPYGAPPNVGQPAALARVDPDQIVRQTMDSNAAALTAYLRTIAPALATDRDADAGYIDAPRPVALSSAPELAARNARYYVTVAAIIAVLAILAAGLVQLATLADLLGASWQWPAWMTLTGGAAFWSIRRLHDATDERTPEGIAQTAAHAQAYATETDAESRREIAAAFADAIRADADARRTDATARALATDAELARISAQPQPPAAPPRQFRIRALTAEQDADLVYATSIPRAALAGPTAQEAPGDAQPAPAVPEHPAPALAAAPPRSASAATADPLLVAVLETISALFADCAQRGDDLIVGRLAWSARGDWPAESKRAALAALARLDPPLIEAGAGGRYRLNRRAWCHPIALTAIRHHWRQ